MSVLFFENGAAHGVSGIDRETSCVPFSIPETSRVAFSPASFRQNGKSCRIAVAPPISSCSVDEIRILYGPILARSTLSKLQLSGIMTMTNRQKRQSLLAQWTGLLIGACIATILGPLAPVVWIGCAAYGTFLWNKRSRIPDNNEPYIGY